MKRRNGETGKRSGNKKQPQINADKAQIVEAVHVPKDKNEALMLKGVQGRTLEERGAVIREHFFCAKAHVEAGAGHALMAGVELCAVKAELKHGEWLPWVKENCPFSEDTAQKYMQAAIHRAEALSNTERARYLIPDKAVEAMTEGERKALAKGLEAMSKGVSIRQLYLQLGMTTADPTKGEPAGIRAEGTPAPGAEFELAKKRAFEIFNGLWETVDKHILRKDTYELLDRVKFDVLFNTLKDGVKKLEKYRKG